MAKSWSRKKAIEILQRTKVKFDARLLESLSNAQFDLLIDYAYYKCHPQERDPFPNRDVAAILKAIKPM